MERPMLLRDILLAKLRTCGYDLSLLSQDRLAEVDRLACAARCLAKETGIDHPTVAKAVKSAASSGKINKPKSLNGGGENRHPAEGRP